MRLSRLRPAWFGWLGLLALCGPAGAAAPAINSPPFDPLAFFTGHVHSEGMVKLVFSKPDLFNTDMHGQMRDGVLLLTQHFTFADHHSQDRVWRLYHTLDHGIAGTANDVVGTASGTVDGNVLHWRYVLATQPGNWLRNVRLDQTMILQPDGTMSNQADIMSNQADISKFGLPLGHVSERFVKQTDQHP